MIIDSNLSAVLIESYDGPTTENGVFYGKGIAIYHSRNVYEGEFLEGKMTGFGKYRWLNEVDYEGEFQANQIEGKGKFTWPNGFVYDGEVRQGWRHGHGLLKKVSQAAHPSKADIIPLGASYSGEWANGKRNGKGVLIYDPTTMTMYDGNWLNDKKHGFGIMKYASGSVYEGQWVNDVKCGHGIMIWKVRNERYIGEWRNGLPNGYGEYVWLREMKRPDQLPFLNSYKGQFLLGKRHGYGIFQYASGARYIGLWRDNKKHGYGVHITENGNIFEGEFRDDQFVGDYIYAFSSDKPYYFSLKGIVGQSRSDFNDVLSGINNVILRHITFLRSIYNAYSSYTWYQLYDDKQPMNRLQLLKMLRDSGASKSGILFTDIDRNIAKAYADDSINFDRYENPHSPTHEFTFYDFLNALIYIANYAYIPENVSNEIECRESLALGNLIKNHLEIHLQPKSISRMFPNYEFVTKAYIDEIRHKIYEIYYFNAKYRKDCLPEATYDKTMTVRDVLLMMKEYSLIDESPFKGLLVKDILLQSAEIIPKIVTDEYFNLEYEILPEELLEILVMCSLYRLWKKTLPSKKSMVNTASQPMLSMNDLRKRSSNSSMPQLAKTAEKEASAAPVEPEIPVPAPAPVPVAAPAPAQPAQQPAAGKPGKGKPAAKQEPVAPKAGSKVKPVDNAVPKGSDKKLASTPMPAIAQPANPTSNIAPAQSQTLDKASIVSQVSKLEIPNPKVDIAEDVIEEPTEMLTKYFDRLFEKYEMTKNTRNKV